MIKGTVKKKAVMMEGKQNPEILRKAFGDVMNRKERGEGLGSKGEGPPAVNHIKHI